ncbi:hypothetical protein ACWC9T_20875 [Kitasatospora sp. NPDC001159]
MPRLARYLGAALPWAALVNLYGPTECTINAAAHLVDPAVLEGGAGYSAAQTTVIELAGDHRGVPKERGVCDLVAAHWPRTDGTRSRMAQDPRAREPLRIGMARLCAEPTSIRRGFPMLTRNSALATACCAVLLAVPLAFAQSAAADGDNSVNGPKTPQEAAACKAVTGTLFGGFGSMLGNALCVVQPSKG